MALNPSQRHDAENAKKKLWERKAQLEAELRETNLMLIALDRMLKPLSTAKLKALEDARQALRELPDSSGSPKKQQ